ncbi:MAG: serine/threonine-protein kinase PknK [Bradymonadaceae bacterium]
MFEPFELGAFLVEEKIGEGGMGTVYRGRHVQTGQEVAVKFIEPTHHGSGARELFRREVQAQAALVHPHIAYLFDYGLVPEGAVPVSGGRFEPGSPYVVMEFAGRGTLRDMMPIKSWGELRAVIVQLLDALAFAHARDVVHRDLKPENILVFDKASPTSRSRILKLGDFGLAHPLREVEAQATHQLQSLSGTPLYMAPEQAYGRWRNFGPWTDLYSLGCMVWELVSGVPPFRSEKPILLLQDHVMAARPVLMPRFDIPGELEEWVHRAMAISVRERFQDAGEAGRALPDLGAFTEDPVVSVEQEGPDEKPELSPYELDSAPTFIWGPTLLMPDVSLAATLSSPTPIEEVGGVVQSYVGAGEGAGELIPPSWRYATDMPDLPAPVVGAGLGLFGLREVPFVDRDGPRDILWTGLREVARERAPRAVLLVGDSGTGKSRLADWLTVRARELGVATVLRATHTRAGEGMGEGLGGMVRAAMRAWKLDEDALVTHILERLPPLDGDDTLRDVDARALAALVAPVDEGTRTKTASGYVFSSPTQKYGLIARLMGRLTPTRPLIVHIDDAQWGPEALGLVKYLLDQETLAMPVLLVLTIRGDLIVDDLAISSLVEGLEKHGQCSRVDIEPLLRADHGELIRSMLPLAPELENLLLERTEGNPLFAVQLLGHWIESSRVVPAPMGFGLAAGASVHCVHVPDDVHQLWMERLTRLIGAFDARREHDLWRALQLAAVMGREIDQGEWEGLEEYTGLDLPPGFVDSLVERGLGRRTSQGWCLTHGLLIESLERYAAAQGVLKDFHRLCAEFLENFRPHQRAQTAARRAHHWLGAGEPQSALAPLWEEQERLRRAGENARRLQVLQHRREILEASKTPNDDPLWLENELERVRAKVGLGAPVEDGIEEFEGLLERAREAGEQIYVCRALWGLCLFRQQQGDLTSSRELGLAALAAAPKDGVHNDLIMTYHSLGWAEMLAGNLESARGYLLRAREASALKADRFLELGAAWAVGWVTSSLGEKAEARALFEEVVVEARHLGYRSLEARCFNGLGNLARTMGEVEAARRYLREYASLSQELGSPEGVAVATLNRAMVEILAGEYGAARSMLGDAKRRYEALSIGRAYHSFEFGFFAIAAGLSDWEQVDVFLDTYRDGLPGDAPLQAGLGWLVQRAQKAIEEDGEPERVGRVKGLAQKLGVVKGAS